MNGLRRRRYLSSLLLLLSSPLQHLLYCPPQPPGQRREKRFIKLILYKHSLPLGSSLGWDPKATAVSCCPNPALSLCKAVPGTISGHSFWYCPRVVVVGIVPLSELPTIWIWGNVSHILASFQATKVRSEEKRTLFHSSLVALPRVSNIGFRNTLDCRRKSIRYLFSQLFIQ